MQYLTILAAVLLLTASCAGGGALGPAPPSMPLRCDEVCRHERPAKHGVQGARADDPVDKEVGR